jgi:hypothetical protein
VERDQVQPRARRQPEHCGEITPLLAKSSGVPYARIVRCGTAPGARLAEVADTVSTRTGL